MQPNVDPEQVAIKFATVFKVPEDKARKLIRSGQEKVLKKEVDPAAATHYRDVLTDIGLVTRIDSADGTPFGAAPQVCPKCGATKINQGICTSCGVLVEAYLAGQSAERKPPPSSPLNLGKDSPLSASAPTAADSPMPGMPPQPTRMPAGHGLGWISAGWALFKQAPLVWIGAVMIFILINIALALVPLIGGLASVLIGPILMAGLMVGAHEQHQGGEFRINHLFEGFSRRTAPLIGVGALYLLGSILIGVLMALLMLGPVISATSGLSAQAIESNPDLMLQSLGPNMLLMLLLALALVVPLMMAYWFAPALVMLNNLDAIAAMKLSFMGCLKNMWPLLIYGLISALLMLLALIPFGLGLLILSPVLIASMYAAYQDIFISQP
ncbi:hypothetical protein CKO36_06405 [Rhabdochromatium marinum]|nr:hypothetical protein [Rhabdochromatium marinum]